MSKTITELLQSYQPSDEAIDRVKDAELVLLVGVTGAGKGTIKSMLLETKTFYDFVSYTTRAPRENNGVMEQNGKEYHFISIEEAGAMLKNGEFIEAKQYAGNVYGTAFEGLKRAADSDTMALNDIEVQGVDEYKRLLPNTVAIFVVPPSFEEWRRRLSTRYSCEEFEKVWPERLAATIAELEHALAVPYYHFVVNDDLEAAAEACLKIAFSHDIFTRKDDEARLTAREILQSIKAHETET